MQIRNLVINSNRVFVNNFTSLDECYLELQRIAELYDERFLDLINWIEKLTLPEYTETEKDAITATNGQMIYNSTNNLIEIYQNGGWVYITNVSSS